MKKNWWILLLLPLLLAATVDRRHDDARFPVTRVEFAQESIATDQTGADTDTQYDLNGTVYGFELIVGDATNAITFTVAFTSENSGTLASVASIADNGTTYLHSISNKGTQDANFNPFLVCGDLTATITPSGAIGGSAAITAQVVVYMR